MTRGLALARGRARHRHDGPADPGFARGGGRRRTHGASRSSSCSRSRPSHWRFVFGPKRAGSASTGSCAATRRSPAAQVDAMRVTIHPTAFVAACALACAAWLTARPDEKVRIADKYMRAQAIGHAVQRLGARRSRRRGDFLGRLRLRRYRTAAFATTYRLSTGSAPSRSRSRPSRSSSSRSPDCCRSQIRSAAISIRARPSGRQSRSTNCCRTRQAFPILRPEKTTSRSRPNRLRATKSSRRFATYPCAFPSARNSSTATRTITCSAGSSSA